MMIRGLFVDGPEKVGKSTLLKSVAHNLSDSSRTQVFTHWNKPTPRSLDHWDVLKRQIRSNPTGDIFWDRTHLSETVYSRLMERSSGLMHMSQLFEAELRYGRIMHALGPRLILLGPDVVTLESRRDASDLPVSVEKERALFEEIGAMFGLKTLANSENVWYNKSLVEKLVKHMVWRKVDLTSYIGPEAAKVVVLDSKEAREGRYPVSTEAQIASLLETENPVVCTFGYATAEADRPILLGATTIVVPDRSRVLRNMVQYYLPETNGPRKVISWSEMLQKVSNFEEI